MADVTPIAPPSSGPVIDIVIRWMPSTGSIQIAWPQVDDVIKLGLIEMAKTSLTEMRLKQADSALVVPQGNVPKLHV